MVIEVRDREEGDGAENEDQGGERDGEGGGVEKAGVVCAEGGVAAVGGGGGESWPEGLGFERGVSGEQLGEGSVGWDATWRR